jgi:hypothetical protein
MSNLLTFALQALLVRHEAYMHDAERDRTEMCAKIEKLESDKKELELQNARTTEENRDLVEQLEGLNGTFAETETHIKSLENTLASTNLEMRRLEMLAARTYDLEAQLAAIEQEQAQLQNTLITTREDERTAIQRWRKAERGLLDLQDQLERIEREAREERERHVEVLGRMERQRAVERELDTAAGRLKSAASATAGNGKNGSNVISHFVKDILQDNANLQAGIVELREMLMNSNDEVQMLREQVMMHQPMTDERSPNATLKAELAPTEPLAEPQVLSQALHIHHHYHGAKKEEPRRPKKKRLSLNNSLFTPPQSIPRKPRGPDTANAILSQTSVTVPGSTPDHRWSIYSGQSDFAPSSVPSSPQSTYRQSGLFDRGVDIDSSRPTSPGSSVDPMSPQFPPSYHRKRGSEVSTRSFVTPTNFQSNVIHEEADGDVEEIDDLETPLPPAVEQNDPLERHFDPSSSDWNTSFPPTLRRSTSHESILSISGIDIHTLKSRPSQLTIRGGNALLRPRNHLGTPTTVVSMDTITHSPIVARPILSSQGHNSSAYLRSTFGSSNLAGSDANSIHSSNSGEANSVNTNGIGTKLGGWVFGRWGMSPVKSTIAPSSAAVPTSQNPVVARLPAHRAVSTPVVPAPSVDPLRAFMGRSPGINQKGPIPGYIKKDVKAPSRVKPESVDHDALREVLMESGVLGHP